MRQQMDSDSSYFCVQQKRCLIECPMLAKKCVNLVTIMHLQSQCASHGAIITRRVKSIVVNTNLPGLKYSSLFFSSNFKTGLFFFFFLLIVFSVLSYLALYRLDELGMVNLRKFVKCQDVNKMHRVSIPSTVM